MFRCFLSVVGGGEALNDKASTEEEILAPQLLYLVFPADVSWDSVYLRMCRPICECCYVIRSVL